MRLPVSVILSLLLAVSVSARELDGPAPDFTLKSNQDRNIRLNELRGKVVMLNFWASWCSPCRKEMPLLDELYQRYSPGGLVVLGVNTDAKVEQANRLLEDIPVNFPIVYDTNGEVSEAYKVDAMPTTVLIDRDGQLRYLHRGYQPGDEEHYRTLIKALLENR